MGKPTGQMQEETQEKLDGLNLLYNWDYNEMCRFIENFSEEEFRDHYETYHRLCDDYGTELVDNFGNHFDMDAEAFEHFEELYQGQYETGWRLCRIHLSRTWLHKRFTCMGFS